MPNPLQQAIQYFSNFENRRQFMISVPWPDGKVRCQNCAAEKAYRDHPKPKHFFDSELNVFSDPPIWCTVLE